MAKALAKIIIAMLLISSIISATSNLDQIPIKSFMGFIRGEPSHLQQEIRRKGYWCVLKKSIGYKDSDNCPRLWFGIRNSPNIEYKCCVKEADLSDSDIRYHKTHTWYEYQD